MEFLKSDETRTALDKAIRIREENLNTKLNKLLDIIQTHEKHEEGLTKRRSTIVEQQKILINSHASEDKKKDRKALL